MHAMVMATSAASLLDPPHPTTKRDIVTRFWSPTSIDQYSLQPYWDFYSCECRRALQDGGRHVQARTHQDILDIVAALQAGQTRSEIQSVLRSKLKHRHSDEVKLVDQSINVAVSLLLMIACGDIAYGFSGGQQLDWETGTLKDCVASQFSKTLALGHAGVKLQRIFNAFNLRSITGIEIAPTSNLLDHLRLTHDDTKLHVFHYASFLKLQSGRYVMVQCLLTDSD